MSFYTRKEITEIFEISLLTVIDWQKKGFLTPVDDRKGRISYDMVEVVSLINEKIILTENALKHLNDKKEEILNKGLNSDFF